MTEAERRRRAERNSYVYTPLPGSEVPGSRAASYNSVLLRLAASGRLADTSFALRRMLLATTDVSMDPTDPEGLFQRLVECKTHEDVRAALAAVEKRLAQLETDPTYSAADERRAFAVAMLMGAQSLMDRGVLEAGALGESLWQIGVTMDRTGQSDLAVVLSDRIEQFVAASKDPAMAPQRELLMQSRLNVMAGVGDVRAFNDAADRWAKVAADQRAEVRVWRWQVRAATLARQAPTSALRDHAAEVWRGIEDMPPAELSGIGTAWLRPRTGESPENYVILGEAFGDAVLREIVRRADAKDWTAAAELLKLHEAVKQQVAGMQARGG
jgi:hypothetical protein